MEGLLKQVRSKFSGKEETSSIREGRTPPTPPQRTSSFKGEKKQKWFKRQFSRQMSFNQPTEEAEYAAAIAAAAFAIASLEPEINDRRTPEARREPSLPRTRTGTRDIPGVTTELGGALTSYEDEHNDETYAFVPEKTIHPVPSVKKNPNASRKRLTFADELAEDTIKPTIGRIPTFGDEQLEDARMKPFSTPTFARTPTFDEEQLEDAQRMKPISTPSFGRTPTVKRISTFGEERMEDNKRTKPPKSPSRQSILPPPIPPPPAIPPLNIHPAAPPNKAQRPRGQETDADAWERDEMTKIKERYQKLNATILEWEDTKKKKARRKLEKTEVRIISNQDSACHKIQKAFLTMTCSQESQSEPEKRRAKAIHNYQIEMERIKQIADGARAQAKDKQRNEELKVKEKANKYRTTGEPPLPPMCLCL